MIIQTCIDIDNLLRLYSRLFCLYAFISLKGKPRQINKNDLHFDKTTNNDESGEGKKKGINTLRDEVKKNSLP
jgi:hypothetical protein